MRALSLWEPWASAMRDGKKTIETRSWSTYYRGPLAICSAKRWSPECQAAADHWAFGYKKGDLYLTGCVVCVVFLTNVRRVEDIEADPKTRALLERGEYAFGNYEAGRYGWETDQSKLFRPEIPGVVRGRQRLFRLSADEVRHLYSQGYDRAA